MKISCFQIEPWQEIHLKKEFQEYNLRIFSEPLNEKNLSEINDSEIIVSRAKFLNLKFNKEILSKLPNLKFISTMSTGFDHIDLEYCKQNNIQVSNVPDYGKNSVAEQTFALILSIIKKIPQAIESLKNNLHNQDLEGMDLNGKTLGVIGSGKIGMNVIKIAKAFNMEVVAYDLVQNTLASKKFEFCYVSLEKLLENSDIITLHIPYNSHTHHLLNSTNLCKLKKGVIVINSARGELIDTNSLIDYLGRRIIAFAGLDVVEGETENIQSPILKKLLGFDNVFITPHNASNTKEAKQKILNTTIENIRDFINNKPQNLVK